MTFFDVQLTSTMMSKLPFEIILKFYFVHFTDDMQYTWNTLMRNCSKIPCANFVISKLVLVLQFILLYVKCLQLVLLT